MKSGTKESSRVWAFSCICTFPEASGYQHHIEDYTLLYYTGAPGCMNAIGIPKCINSAEKHLCSYVTVDTQQHKCCMFASTCTNLLDWLLCIHLLMRRRLSLTTIGDIAMRFSVNINTSLIRWTDNLCESFSPCAKFLSGTKKSQIQKSGLLWRWRRMWTEIPPADVCLFSLQALVLLTFMLTKCWFQRTTLFMTISL